MNSSLSDPDILKHHPQRIGQLKDYGSGSLAYSTLQCGLKYFETAAGYFAYSTFSGTRFVLSDPVAPQSAWPRLVRQFLREHPNCCFCQISHSLAQLLVRFGFAVNEFGTNFYIHISSYDFAGLEKKHIRYAESRLNRDGYRIAELHETNVNWTSISNLSEAWRKMRINKTRETAFLSRPIVLADEMDTRKFFVIGPEGVVAFVFFDPIYQGGNVVGYLSNSKRYLPTAPQGFDFAVTKFALERFRREGKTLLHLGSAPFHGVEDAEFPSNPITTFLSRFCYPRKWLYNFRGIAEHKSRYRGETEKVYIATCRWFSVIDLIRLARVCKIL